MKTSVAKTATVAAVICAIAVSGVAVAVTLGGPDWIGIAQQIDGYSFTHVGGETPTWSASKDVTGENVRSAPSLPDVIIPALDDKINVINQQSAAAKQRREALEAQLAAEKPLTEVDRKALDERLVELREQIVQINQQTAQRSAELLSVNEEIAALEARIEDRRGDVQRHDTLMGVVDADIFRLKQLRQQLADLIVQIDGDLATAERRENQLIDILGQTKLQ